MCRTTYTMQTTVPMRDCENGSSLPKCTLACTHEHSYTHTRTRGRGDGGKCRDATKYFRHTNTPIRQSVYVYRLWGESTALRLNVTYRKINILNRRCCPAVKARNFIYLLESTTFWNHKNNDRMQIAQRSIHVRFALLFDDSKFHKLGSFQLQFW